MHRIEAFTRLAHFAWLLEIRRQRVLLYLSYTQAILSVCVCLLPYDMTDCELPLELECILKYKIRVFSKNNKSQALWVAKLAAEDWALKGMCVSNHLRHLLWYRVAGKKITRHLRKPLQYFTTLHWRLRCRHTYSYIYDYMGLLHGTHLSHLTDVLSFRWTAGNFCLHPSKRFYVLATFRTHITTSLFVAANVVSADSLSAGRASVGKWWVLTFIWQ